MHGLPYRQIYDRDTWWVFKNRYSVAPAMWQVYVQVLCDIFSSEESVYQ